MTEQFIHINKRGERFCYRDKRMTILHREDGPAVEYNDGDRIWYKDGRLHRDGGPAIEWADGATEWWLNGKIHREDGPAIEQPGGICAWYLNDVEVTEEEHNRHKNKMVEHGVV